MKAVASGHPAVMLFHGDCLDVLAEIPDASIDAIVTDPPYELGFMGRAWDASGIAYSVDLWRECLRVLKPGGHLLAFGGTRTGDPATSLARNPGRPDLVTSDTYGSGRPQQSVNLAGHWPTNVVMTHAATPDGADLCTDGCVPGCPVAELDAQSDAVSRFFPVFRYQAKAPTRERPRADGTAHPTVKPLELMRWLVRLVTPPGGLVLDPFAGSGTTAEAAIAEGARCLAIEQHQPYIPLIQQRLTTTTAAPDAAP